MLNASKNFWKNKKRTWELVFLMQSQKKQSATIKNNTYWRQLEKKSH